MSTKITGRIFLAVIVVGTSGCLQDNNLSKLSNDMVVSTNYDQSAPFNNYDNFVIRKDTIGLVSNQTDQKFIANDKDQFASKVIAGVTNQMTNAGYAKVNVNDEPDLGVYIFVLDNFDAFQQLVYPSYYPGSYYGGYGYYGYYYPYVQTYVSQYATLVIQVVDLKKTSANVVWTAYIGDLYASPDYVTKSVEAIDQAFAQSPYLNKN